MHPFEGSNATIQSTPADPKRNIEYALVHKLLDGVFHMLPIDETDATETVRAANCRKTKDSSCSIKTRKHLLALALPLRWPSPAGRVRCKRAEWPPPPANHPDRSPSSPMASAPATVPLSRALSR